jgi:hypothetical protein
LTPARRAAKKKIEPLSIRRPVVRRVSDHDRQGETMRFLITATSADKQAKNDGPPDERLFDAYMKFNEEMTKAGVLIAAEGRSGWRARTCWRSSR